MNSLNWLINFSEEENTLLYVAIKKGNTKIIQFLLKQNDIDVNKIFTAVNIVKQNIKSTNQLLM